MGTRVGCSRGIPVKVMKNANDDVVVKKKTSEEASWTDAIPTPIQKYASDAEIRADCFDNKYYYKVDFWDGHDIWSVDAGSHVLWKKAPLGPNGGPSTKQEFFHGVVHGWENHTEIILS